MATILVHTSPAAGHAFPLVTGLLELRARGHAVHVRTDPGAVAALRAAGLDAEPVDPRISAIRVGDHEAKGRDRLGRGLSDMMARAPFERAQVEADIAALAPDVLLIDMNDYGGQVAAARAGLPWALTVPTLLPLPGKGIPPFGLGLKPRASRVGRVRDHLATRLVLRLYGKAMLPGVNAVREPAGLPPFTSALEFMAAPDRLIGLTGAPLEYPRRDLPAHVRLVGATPWDPPVGEVPAWLEEPGDPWILVTCSTEYQGDERLAAAAIEAMRGERVRVVVTLADAHGAAELPSAPNARVERFVPHAPVLERAAAVVAHGGMGITQKAIAAGVPLVVVPFGRDQPEVARRVTEAGVGVTLRPGRLTPARLRAAVRTAVGLRPAVAAAAATMDVAGAPARFAAAVEELVPAPVGVAATVLG
jgi:UDP:flavonoid glycosyltransferase YjiC (YdhE family)